MENANSRGGRIQPGSAIALGLFCLAVLSGCSSAPKNQSAAKPIFYPPPPDPPRLQFLTSFSDDQDVGVKMSKFATLVTGVSPTALPIVKPYGVTMHSNCLFVCDTGSRSVLILDLAAKSMRSFSPAGPGRLGAPINLAIASDGARYLADSARNQVLIFGSDDSYQGAVGDPDTMKPTGVAIQGGRLFISDLKGHCVQVFDRESRQKLFTIPRQPDASEEQEPGKLFMPVNLAVDPHGKIYVSDTASCLVKVFDQEGKHLRTIGGLGDTPGRFARPKGIAADAEGRIYVVDAAAQACQIFNQDGKLLLSFGEPEGSPASLNLPAGLAVDSAHVALFQKYAAPNFVLEQLVIIANQFGDRKVSIYGLGHRK